MIDVVELFAGVGGFRVGLNRIEKYDKNGKADEKNGRWNFVWANQWEPSTKIQKAYECYITRFGKDNVSNVDIAKVDKNEIPNHDLLVGGFPCQDYSVARSLSNEMGIEGKKGVLWWEIAKTILAKKPNFILLENVDRLLKSPAKQRGRDFAVMLKTFQKLGYIVQWRVINAGEYGMPQRRRRVFIFASNEKNNYSKKIMGNKDLESFLINESLFNKTFPILKDNINIEKKDLSKYIDSVDVSDNYNQKKFLTSGIFLNGKVYNFDATEITEPYFTLGDVIKEAEQYNDNLEKYIIDKGKINKWIYLKESKKVQRKRPDGKTYYYSEGKMTYPDSLDLPARTMLTSEGTLNRSSHYIWDEKIKQHRIITEVEAELIQMFPANWTNTGMTSRQRYFMMGNALVTGILTRMEDLLYNIIIEDKK